MFILLGGPRTTETDGVLERMAAELRGGGDAPRVWQDRDRNAGAASLKPDFVPEDASDAQPIVNDARVFVCQARIDNRNELLPLLDVAHDVADSTLFAAAYDRWGAECVQKVTGDFAFAVWHRADGSVVAAVDHHGARRLMWSRIANGIALSAQLAPLLVHPEISRDPDLDALARLFDSGIDRTSTPFTAIRAIPGGHLFTWRAGEVRIERWWNPSSRPSVWYRDRRQYVDEARELFTRAVASQLRSSSAISTTLSGGLDSGSVTATAARLSSSRITAYTSIPEPGLAVSQRPNWEPDDRTYAAEVAAMYDNVDHRVVPPGGRCALDVIASIHARSHTPSKATTNMLWLDGISAAAAAAGSRVLLTGQYGNAAFSWRGDGTISELVMNGHLRAALQQARDEARARNSSVARVLAGSVRGAMHAMSRRTVGDTVVRAGLQFIRRPRSPHARGNEYVEAPGSRRFWRAFVTTPKQTWWPDPVVQWGVEWRDPTIDRRLVERLLQYPQAAFRIGGRERGLARELAAGLLPDRVRLRRTQGAQVPEAPSLIAAHAQRYRAALEVMRRSPACRELFDFDAMQRALDGFASGSLDFQLATALDVAFDAGLFLEHAT
jgi:asparagine synthase (glutamine-hydrolysing)